MKKSLLLVFSAILFFVSQAQNQNNDTKIATLKLVEQNKEVIGLTDNNLSNIIISSTYVVPGTGMTMVYLQQTFKGIPVLNIMKVLAFKEGKLVSNTGSLIEEMDKAASASNGIPSVSAPEAVRLAFAVENLAPPVLRVINISDNGRLIEYARPSGMTEALTAELLWFPIEKDKIVSVKLGWQIQVATTGKDDIWQIRIDALTGQLIEKVNLVIYEDFRSHHRNETASGFGSRVEKYSGEVNGINRIMNEPDLVGTANYNVIPFPYEAPSFTPAAIRTNPWTAAPGNATSLGWHNDGVDYTISRGNNVWATEDTLGEG